MGQVLRNILYDLTTWQYNCKLETNLLYNKASNIQQKQRNRKVVAKNVKHSFKYAHMCWVYLYINLILKDNVIVNMKYVYSN